MKSVPRCLMLVVLYLTCWSGATAAETTWWHPAPGLTWQWQLDGDFETTQQPVDAYDLDGELFDTDTALDLSDAGVFTICYVNVGSIEDWRGDLAAFPASVIGNIYPGWEDERFLDIRQIDVLGPIMEARFDQCAAKGFDAIEPDNMDSWDADTGFPLTRDDAIRYATWLAETAHARGLAIAQKNAPDLTTELVDTFDFAITESCAQDNWCADLRPYLGQSKAVLAAEYTDVTTAAEFREMCATADLAGISLIYKHRDLDAWREDCRR